MKRIWNGDVVLAKYKLLGHTYVIGRCEPGDVDWPQGGFAIYIYDKNYCRKWKQIYGNQKFIPVLNELHLMIRMEMDSVLEKGITDYFASVRNTREFYRVL